MKWAIGDIHYFRKILYRFQLLHLNSGNCKCLNLFIQIIIFTAIHNNQNCGIVLFFFWRNWYFCRNFLNEKASWTLSTHHIKSLQWEQKVGCLKNLGINLWSFILYTFFFFKAPFRPLNLNPNLELASPSSFWFSSSAILNYSNFKIREVKSCCL